MRLQIALSERESSESFHVWCIYILEITDNDSGSVSINYRIYELFVTRLTIIDVGYFDTSFNDVMEDLCV